MIGDLLTRQNHGLCIGQTVSLLLKNGVQHLDATIRQITINGVTC